MDDLISRQAAIAHAVPLNLFGREVMMVSVSELENLPSALPDHHGRLVDADALIIDLMNRGLESVQTDDWAEIQQTVMEQPTIVESEGE